MDGSLNKYPNLTEFLVECSLSWEELLTRLASVCKRRNRKGIIRIFIKRADDYKLSHIELRLAPDHYHVEYVIIKNCGAETIRRHPIINKGETHKERIRRVLNIIINLELRQYDILSLKFCQF